MRAIPAIHNRMTPKEMRKRGWALPATEFKTASPQRRDLDNPTKGRGEGSLPDGRKIMMGNEEGPYKREETKR